VDISCIESYQNRKKMWRIEAKFLSRPYKMDASYWTGILLRKSFAEQYYRVTNKSLTRPNSLSIVFSVQGTGGSPTGPDPENRVRDQDIGSPCRLVSSGLQVLCEPFPSWSG
jgi:hypothetical protein